MAERDTAFDILTTVQVQFLKLPSGVFNYRISVLAYPRCTPYETTNYHQEVVRGVGIDTIRAVCQEQLKNPYLSYIHAGRGGSHGVICIEYTYDYSKDDEKRVVGFKIL